MHQTARVQISKPRDNIITWTWYDITFQHVPP